MTVKTRVENLEHLEPSGVIASVTDATKALWLFETGKITREQLDALPWEPSLSAGLTCANLGDCQYWQRGQACSCSVDCAGYVKRAE